MSNLYKITYNNQLIPFEGKVDLHMSRSFRNDSLLFHAYCEGKLYTFEYNSKSDLWSLKREETLVTREPSQSRILHFPDSSQSDRTILVLKSAEGLEFYNHEEDGFKILVKTRDFDVNAFNDVYEWQSSGSFMKSGFFYNDPSLLGLLTYRQKYGLKLYAVFNTELRNRQYPTFQLQTNQNVVDTLKNARFYLADLQMKGQENIIVNSKEGLNIYLLNKLNNLEHLMHIPTGGKEDDSDEKLFFANISGQSYQDVVMLNTSGMFVFQYKHEKNNYEFIYYCSKFSKVKGWNSNHLSSIKFEDIDSDGKKEMLFTGPGGLDLLSFDVLANAMKPLLDNSGLDISQHHGNVVHYSANISATHKPMVFTQYRNTLQWGYIIEAGPSVKKFDKPENVTQLSTDPVIPQSDKLRHNVEGSSSHYLRETLDWSPFLDAVDPCTGKLKLKLQLVDLSSISSHIKLNLYYDGNSQVSSILGVGWSLPQTFIVMDHQSSIFPEDETFYMFIDDYAQPLKLDYQNSTETISRYKMLNDQSDVNITFYKSDERWEVRIAGTKQIFGRTGRSSSDPIDWELTWDSWRGLGSSSTGQKQLSTAWFLSEVSNLKGDTIHYEYDVVNVEVTTGKSYTRELYLTTVRDNRGNSIILTYSDKDKTEVKKQSIGIDEDYIATQKYQTKFLSAYSVITRTYRQDIKLFYKLEDGKRTLNTIVQENDPVTQPVLELNYKKTSNLYMIDKATLPSGATVYFDYESIGTVTAEQIETRIDVPSRHRVDFGNDDVLISYINKEGQVALRMLSHDMSRDLFTNKSYSGLNRVLLLGQGSVGTHEIVRADSFLAVLVHYKHRSSKELCLVRKQGGKWTTVFKCYSFSKKTTIGVGKDFAVASEPGSSLDLISWNTKETNWKIEKLSFGEGKVNSHTLIKVFDRMFLLYDDDMLRIGLRDSSNKWKLKVIKKLPGLVNSTKKVIDQFSLNDKINSELFMRFKANSMHFSNNLVFLNRLQLEGTQLSTIANFIVLDSNYRTAFEQQFTLVQDDLGKFSLEIEGKDKNVFTIGYNKSSEGKFNLMVKNMRGPIFDKINEDFNKALKDNLSKVQSEFCRHNVKKTCEKEKNKVKNDIENQKERSFNELRDSLLNLIGTSQSVLNSGNYTAVLNKQTAMCGGNLYTFNGEKWIEKRQPQVTGISSVLLGEKLVLVIDYDRSSINLFSQGSDKKRQGNSLFNFGVSNITQTIITNMYPIYLAYQEKNTRAVVIEFTAEGNIEKSFKLPVQESLSPWSTFGTLVTTVKNIGMKDSNTLMFRQQSGIKQLLPNPVIKSMNICYDENKNKRSTGYDYDVTSAKAQGNIVYYSRTIIIPGNDKLLTGWIEEFRDSNSYSVLERRVFDAKGKLIKTLKVTERTPENKTDNDTEKDELDYVLLDKTEKLKVAQFSPFTVADGEVGYYGFEDYEVNYIKLINSTMNEKQWLFNENDVRNQDFGFTGKTFLRLSNESSIHSVFEPENQQQYYVASSWVRLLNSSLRLGDVTPCLMTSVMNKQNEEILVLISEVKYRYSEWFYLEVVIDLPYLKHVYKGLLGSPNSTFTGLSEDPLKLCISLVPEKNSTVDVDHVRFSPLNSRFKAFVYDSETGQVTESIDANGSVKRHLYDKYQVEIASIDEQGRLESLTTYSKASSTGNTNKRNSKVSIKPETGFYEDFSQSSFQERWSIEDASAWVVLPGHLRHVTTRGNSIRLNPYDVSTESYGFRLCFSLQSENSLLKLGKDLELVRNGSKAHVSLLGTRLPAPVIGEMLVVAEHSRLFVWVDGGLYFESLSNSSLFDWKLSGKTTLSGVMVFSKPEIQVDYFNELNDIIQNVVLESENSVIVTEYLYDHLGRQAITTQPVLLGRSKQQSLLSHYSRFVVNSDFNSTNSVWRTGRLQGDITDVVGEYGYHRIRYEDNPLDQKSAVGMPGEEFSVSGPYAKRYTSFTENNFITFYFPVKKNYTYWIEYRAGNVEDITVYDNKNNKIAWYVRVPGKRSVLSTYEYNGDNKVIKSLPPVYHEQVRTLFSQTTYQSQPPTDKEKYLQDKLGTHTSYDDKGNIVSKTTPDSGKVKYLYDENGLLKFTVYYSNIDKECVESVTYFSYDGLGRCTSTGNLRNPPSVEMLLSSSMSTNDTEEYQKFHQSDLEREPSLRGNVQRTTTFNDGEPLVEESILNTDKETLSKRLFIPVKEDYQPFFITINKIYQAKKLKVIEYPTSYQGRPLKINYSYDKLGRISGISVLGDKSHLVRFKYNADGLPVSEEHLPGTRKSFTRQYSYNSPGFLTELKDRFLTETVYYTCGSYGGHGYGDGTVTRTKFQATWHTSCDNDKLLELNELSFVSENLSADQSALCFDKLKEQGYLNENNRQSKIFYPELEVNLPIVCSHASEGRQIQHILGTKGFPSEYGHSYDYGNQNELTKAKYFVGNEEPSPLQPSSFSKEVSGINSTDALDIWNILTKHSTYLVSDMDKANISQSHANKGKSFIRPTLFTDVKNISDSLGGFSLSMEKYLLFAFSKRQNLTLIKSNLPKAFLEWPKKLRTNNLNQTVNSDVKRLIRMLEEKKYFQTPIDEEYINLLEKYEEYIPEITRVLLEHFGKQLCEAEFDVQSYSIDANGNHRLFYTGFDRYELKYRDNTNQISSVTFKSSTSSKPEQEYNIKHDSRGNVVQALHKGIDSIVYHPVLNRAIKMHLSNGDTVSFYYDAKGERILKRLSNSRGATKKEKHYIRDELGRTLVERQVTYLHENLMPDVLVTAYVYGPRGLLGFIRNDEFHSVITDHEGSIRLVVKGEEVVAAYDYLPYGGLMREYGPDPENHISYRYTGQEWDEELALYNYHARFYDPNIGRFYQIDPKMQYFSPYKYAGNSPVSQVDPNGEVSYLIPILIGAGVLLGIYIGGAAANNEWNPIMWTFDTKTVLGMVFGGLAGGFIIVGSVASFGVLAAAIGVYGAVGVITSLAAGGLYISTSTSNNEWDPREWDYSSPITYNGAFQGVSMGVSVVSGFHSAASFYKSLATALGKGVFITSSTTAGVGMFVANGFSVNWDFTKPGVYFGVVDAVTGAPDLPMFLKGAARFMGKNSHSLRNSYQSLRALYKHNRSTNPVFSSIRKIFTEIDLLSSSNKLVNKHIWDELVKSLGKIVGGTIASGSSALLLASVNSENGFDLSEPLTYQNIIHGMITGGQLASTGRLLYKKVKSGKSHIRLDSAIEIENAAQNEVKHALQEYVKKKEELGGTSSGDKTVPNTAVSVAFTKDKELTLVTFSGTGSEGLIVFKHPEMNEPHTEYLPRNKQFEGKPITVDQSVYDAVQSVKKSHRELLGNYFERELVNIPEIKGNTLKQLKMQTNENISKSVYKSLVQELKLYVEDIKNTKIINQKILENLLLKVVKEKLGALEPSLKSVKQAIENLEQKILKTHPKDQVRNKYYEELEALQSQHDDLIESKPFLIEAQKRQNRIKVAEEMLANVGVKDLLSVIKEHMSRPFPSWDPSNCAEASAVVCLSRHPEPVRKYTQGKSYGVNDVEYMATYRVPKQFPKHGDIDGLVPFERCEYCKITTSGVKNIITDPDWINYVSLLKKYYLSKKRLFSYFLMPYIQLSFRMPNNNSNNGYIPNRRKRSLDPNIIELLPKAVTFQSSSKDYRGNIPSPVKIGTTRTANIIARYSMGSDSLFANLYDWATSSIDVLFKNADNKPNNQPNTVTQVDVNGTILLIDLLVRKLTGRKFVSTIGWEGSLMQAQVSALNITEAFEQIIKKSAVNSGMPITDLIYDPVTIQSAVLKELRNGTLSHLSQLLLTFAKEASVNSEVHGREFLDHVKQCLREILSSLEET